MAMRGPKTFTGEDTIEINCHGGTYVVSRVLETVLKNGARTRRTREFTTAGIPERKDGSVSGGGGHRCDHLSE